MPDVLHFPLKEESLLDIQSYDGLRQGREYLLNMVNMFLNRFPVDDQILYVDGTCFPFELRDY